MDQAARNKFVRLMTEANVEVDKAEAEATKTGDRTLFNRVERQQVLRGLRATIAFLHSDPEILDSGLTRLLARALNAIHDRDRGAKPDVIESKAEEGRPTGLISDIVRGHLAFALDTLVIQGRMKLPEAAGWLAREAAQYGIRSETGAALDRGQLIRWRNDVRRKEGAVEAREVFDELQKVYQQRNHEMRRLSAEMRLAISRKSVRAILQNLANLAPHDAPASRAH